VFSALIATDLEDLTAGDSNLDPIALFEIESLHHRRWQANRQAVSPPLKPA
jgi:hypothetical protein